MADDAVTQWQVFFERVQRDMYATYLVDVRKTLPAFNAHVPFEYYTILYGYTPADHALAADDVVRYRLQYGSLIVRLHTVWSVWQFLRLSRWLDHAVGDRVGAVPTLAWTPWAPDRRFMPMFVERLRFRLLWLVMLEMDPQQRAVAANESALGTALAWMFEAAADGDRVVVPPTTYDALPALVKAQRQYGRWLKAYRVIAVPRDGEAAAQA